MFMVKFRSGVRHLESKVKIQGVVTTPSAATTTVLASAFTELNRLNSNPIHNNPNPNRNPNSQPHLPVACIYSSTPLHKPYLPTFHIVSGGTAFGGPRYDMVALLTQQQFVLC